MVKPVALDHRRQARTTPSPIPSPWMYSMAHGRKFYQPTPHLEVTNSWQFEDWIWLGSFQDGGLFSFDFKRSPAELLQVEGSLQLPVLRLLPASLSLGTFTVQMSSTTAPLHLLVLELSSCRLLHLTSSRNWWRSIDVPCPVGRRGRAWGEEAWE